MKISSLIGVVGFLFAATSRALARSTAPPTRQPPIAVLGIAAEVKPFTAQLAHARKVHMDGYTFYFGDIRSTPVVVAEIGVGKVNAAALATIMIHAYHPSALLFSGTSGALDPKLEPGDLVIGTSSVQYDFGERTDKGFEVWQTTNPKTARDNPLLFNAAPSFLDAAMAAACHVDLDPIGTGNTARYPNTVKGIIATGDTFLADPAAGQLLRSELHADAVEMEGAAVAQVSYQENIPCLIVRSISDNANGDSPQDYQHFLELASKNSAALVESIITEARRINLQEIRNRRLGRRQWDILFELPFAYGSPYASEFGDRIPSDYSKHLAIARSVLTRLARLALKEDQVNSDTLLFGPGTYDDVPVHPSVRLRVTADAQQLSNLALMIGFLDQQTEIIATTYAAGGDTQAVEIESLSGNRLSDPDFVGRLWKSLQKAIPRFTEGFSPTMVNQRPGIEVIDTLADWKQSDHTIFERAIRHAAASIGTPVRVVWKRVWLNDYCNPWTMLPDGSRYLGSISGAGAISLRRRLVSADAPQIGRWLEEALGTAKPAVPESSTKLAGSTSKRFRHRLWYTKNTRVGASIYEGKNVLPRRTPAR